MGHLWEGGVFSPLFAGFPLNFKLLRTYRLKTVLNQCFTGLTAFFRHCRSPFVVGYLSLLAKGFYNKTFR